MPILDAVHQAATLNRQQPILATVWAPAPLEQPYRAITAYRAMELFARGEFAWLEKYYAWARGLGANTLRVYGVWAATGYSPRTFRKYYEQLADAFAHAERSGFWVHYLALRDQGVKSNVYLPAAAQADHVMRTVELARRAGNVLFEIGIDNQAQFGSLVPARVPSLMWEPDPIGGDTTPGQHAVHAAVREESGEGWVIHGGFSSQISPPIDSDLQNCIAPEEGPALECARAVAEVWKASPCPFCYGTGVLPDEGE